MRKIIVIFLTASAYQLAFAEQPPVVGLWEQLPLGDADGSSKSVPRVDVIFVDRKIDQDTEFAGLSDIDTQSEVLCCVNVRKDALITLSELLKKYPWPSDIADHIKKIEGWKYIYEARVVDSGERNARMRELIKDLSMPPAASPYSDPVIAGRISAKEVNNKGFKVGNTGIAYSMRVSEDKSIVSYRFSINGKPVTLTEENFPD